MAHHLHTLEGRIAARLSREIFKARGNHSEVHLQEAALETIIEEAIKLYVKASIASTEALVDNAVKEILS